MKQPTSQIKGMRITSIKYGYPIQGSELKLCTDEALQEAYANAKHTFCFALGHGKSQANVELQQRWYLELHKRGLTPDGREGKTNGNGST